MCTVYIINTSHFDVIAFIVGYNELNGKYTTLSVQSDTASIGVKSYRLKKIMIK